MGPVIVAGIFGLIVLFAILSVIMHGIDKRNIPLKRENERLNRMLAKVRKVAYDHNEIDHVLSTKVREIIEETEDRL